MRHGLNALVGQTVRGRLKNTQEYGKLSRGIMLPHRPMFHMVRTVLLVGVLGILATPVAFGAAPTIQEEGRTKATAIALTVAGALAAGLLLYQLSQQTGSARYKEDAKGDTSRRQVPLVGGQQTLLPAIVRELNQLQGSRRHREDVARTVSALVTETIRDEVESAKEELANQYIKIIEEQRRSEAILQRKYQTTLIDKKQTVAVLESIAEGLVVVNNKGEVVMMNPAAARLLAMDDKERIGKSLLDHLDDKQLVSLVQASHNKEDREIVLSAKEESTKRILRASNAMVTDENGNTVGMVSVLSDVTKQRELDQMKSDFVSKVSHELRTPIVAMQHALAILSDQVAGALSEEQQKFVNLSKRNLERLNGLINDLLDLSRLEAKKMELRLQSGAIAPVIQHVCDSLTPWANSKAISLTRRFSDDLPDVLFDQARITQVLTNLVGNAIKFTPKQGRIIIEAKRAEAGEVLEVSVSDSGPGIAKEDIPKLFSKFQQVGERTATDIGGTGLGLAIAKEIVELHKGRIWVDPQVQEGTRFVFTLPLAPSPSRG